MKNKFDFGVDTQKFKREYASTQLNKLYLQLYANVAQSEFVKKFHDISAPLEEIPYVEVNKSIKRETREIFKGSVVRVTEEEKQDAITEFNKINIANIIIEKGEHARQDLLKLAVAYRYVHPHYQNDSIVNVGKFRDEELKLIFQIVNHIVKYTNENLKTCRLQYNKKELKSGKMEISAIGTKKSAVKRK